MACAEQKTPSPRLDPGCEGDDDDDDASAAKSATAGTPTTSDSLKRKHHRRAKRSGRRRRSSLNQSGDASSPAQAASPATDMSLPADREAEAPQVTTPGSEERKVSSPEAVGGAGPSPGGRHRPHRHHRGKKQQVYLRPTNGPLLRAPSNSTQFIIDDHENSHLFFSFEQQPNYAATPHSHTSATTSNGRERSVGPASGSASADDDTLWAEYSERDFQSVYETAHHEEVSTWDRKRLCEEISSLERKQKELANALARLDPDVYLQQLQSQLLTLQETNRSLREQASRLGDADPVAPDSSTGTEEAEESGAAAAQHQPEAVQEEGAASQH